MGIRLRCFWPILEEHIYSTSKSEIFTGMQKIILTVTNDLAYDQRMQRICGSLSRGGYVVCLVGRKRKSSQELLVADFQQIRLQCYWEHGKLFYLEFNIRLFFFLLSQSFDTLCAVDLDTILPCWAVARLKRKKCVYDAHEYFTEVPEVVDRPLVKGIWEIVARFAIPRMDLCYTVGPQLGNLLSARYHCSFHVIRNLPFASSGEPSLVAQDPKIILYQGALNEGRGLEQAITAMQAVRDAELWLVGEGDLSAELRQLSMHLKVMDRVKFLGLVRPHELKAITCRAYIGLNLLENKGLSYYYSLANKAFDYIQAGIPSIQMNFPEYQDLHTLYGFFVLVNTPSSSEIIRAIRQLLDDEIFYTHLQNNCLTARAMLTWEKEEPKLLALYRQL